MKNKHWIALALMASLGLMTFSAKNVNAKDNQSANNHPLVSRAKSQSNANNVSQLLPRNVNSIRFNHELKSHQNLKRMNHLIHKSVKGHIHLTKLDKKLSRDLSTFAKLPDQRVHPKRSKDVLHEIHGPHHMNMKDHNLMKHEMMNHNAVHVDNNQQNIGGMNQFSNSRGRYLYNQIGGNTRDLGGYLTDHSKYRIAPDRIIRSADLDGLSSSGIKVLNQLHVNKIIDLRYYTGEDGIQGHPDPGELQSKKLQGSGIDYQVTPVYSHTEAHHLKKYMKSHGEHGEYYYYGDLSVSEPQAIKTYRRVFKDLLNNHHGAILFHCNLGRDRTGVTSALILSALGVNRNVIYHDYLLTYRYHYNFAAKNPNYSSHAAELQYFFKTINNKYGSVNNYLSSKIGLNRSKLMKLRKMYLVRNRG